jgi:hypothetical protein
MKRLKEKIAWKFGDFFFPGIKGNLQIYIKILLFKLEVEILLKLVTRKNTRAHNCIY